MTAKEEFEWNDALSDLRLLAEIERSAIEANLTTNVVNYYKLLKAYFQKLCSMVVFDRTNYVKRFDDLKGNIFSLDQNNDGKVDEWERLQNATVLGKAMEDLEQIYYELSEIKVTSGLSVQKVYYNDALRRQSQKRQAKDAPILEFK